MSGLRRQNGMSWGPAWGSLLVVAVVIVGGLRLASPPTVEAQPASPPSETTCMDCHHCPNPTAEKPCLRECQRDRKAHPAIALSEQPATEVILLDALVNHYLPVPFDHKGHAEMTGMTGNCETCHHYTPPGEEHPTCQSCHEARPVREDIRKPGLKGAYHRQCIGCHRDWAGEQQCVLCHPAKTGQPGQAVPTKDDLLGQMHPPIPEPVDMVYDTSAPESLGAKVLFRHQGHVRRFGLACAECHREENCRRCHQEGAKHTPQVGRTTTRHQACGGCHEVKRTESCQECHYAAGQPQPAPFDHAGTGWPLSRYHRERSCRSCHRTTPFAKLDRDCATCHGDWQPDTFNHAVTGQILDENHAETDCEECHTDRKFDTTPTCTECHDEEEGITFPTKRPGPQTKENPPTGP